MLYPLLHRVTPSRKALGVLVFCFSGAEGGRTNTCEDCIYTERSSSFIKYVDGKEYDHFCSSISP